LGKVPIAAKVACGPDNWVNWLAKGGHFDAINGGMILGPWSASSKKKLTWIPEQHAIVLNDIALKLAALLRRRNLRRQSTLGRSRLPGEADSGSAVVLETRGQHR